MSRVLRAIKAEFIGELKTAFTLWRFTVYGVLLKIKLRNANSKLGILWEPISTLLVSSVLTLVWVKVLNVRDGTNYFTYVYSGMVIWAAISSSISNLCATLVKNSPKLISRPISKFSYIFEDILLSIFPFFLSIPMVLAVAMWHGDFMSLWQVFQFGVGVLNLVLACFGFGISVGVIAFMLGDIRQLITSVMRLGFLITPVIWTTDRLGEYEKYLIFNPFYGYLHSMRQPLMGFDANPYYFFQSLSLSVLMIVVGVALISTMSLKIQERALTS